MATVSIPLHSHKYPGLFAIVDEEDCERVSRYRWYPQKCRTEGFYACSVNRGTHIRMHRLIMDAPDSVDVDHRNRHTLDNRKGNLRLCTRSQNSANTPKAKKRNPSSIYKGVYFLPRTNAWGARCNIQENTFNLGCYTTEVEAAVAYDQAMLAMQPDFAYFNFPDSADRPKPQRLARRRGRKGTSGYYGVTWNKARAKWNAAVYHDYKRHDAGCFDDSATAARAYDTKVRDLGLSLPLNFP
jgi:hypothetical protein